MNSHQNYDGMQPGASRTADENLIGKEQITHLKNEFLDSAIQNAELQLNSNSRSEEFTPKASAEAKFKTIFHYEAN